jgi:hypothetical protein
MASRATWAERIEEWRESGLTSEEFCRGKPYSAGGLRSMASVICSAPADREAPEHLPGRVVRVAVSPARRTEHGRFGIGEDAEAVLEVHGIRVAVRSGCSAQTLSMVVGVVREGDGR